MIVLLTPDIVFRITAKKELYESVSFLMPMRNSALKIHSRIPKKKCSHCVKNAIKNFSRQLAGAFTALLIKEHAKSENELAKLKATIAKLLNMKATEIQLSYKDPKGNDVLLQF